jgi:hypothetical protein
MRQPVTPTRLQQFMNMLGTPGTVAARVYLVGGASAVLLGWRDTTIDVDLKIVPENDEILRRLPRLKESLQLNVELAAPDDFIPELPGWQERSLFIEQIGKITFLHYDFYAQALAKIERGHATDVLDVNEMIRARLVDAHRLLEFFTTIEPQLYRYPAVDGPSFKRAVERVVEQSGQ